MDKGTEPPKPTKREKRRFRGKVTPRITIEDRVVEAAVADGSRFRGHEPFLVQALVISASATRYQRERWVTPDGRTILAPLPEGIDGHFGPELRRFVLMQYHQGQSTLPRLAALLTGASRSILPPSGIGIHRCPIQSAVLNCGQGQWYALVVPTG
jgi:hypothetical protein